MWRIALSHEQEIEFGATALRNDFGNQAITEASMRADKALALNDLENQGLWRRVIKAISALTEAEAEPLH